MQIGVVFPQAELGPDPGAVRYFATSAEGFGFQHLLVYDHVVGADPAVHVGWSSAYDVDTELHEPLILLAHLAAVCSLEFVTGILIVPQRQTVLVAKQAAEIDLLSRGKLRLGVGLGWNAVEYQALDKEFSNRGARLSEQIELLRLLTSQRSITFTGAYERVIGAGIAPLPVQRPIPIWMGGSSPAALRRIGRLADGWFPQPRGATLEDSKAIVDEAARHAGRDPSAIGMDGWIDLDPQNPARVADEVERWARYGATHVSINSRSQGLRGVDAHLEAFRAAAEAVGLSAVGDPSRPS